MNISEVADRLVSSATWPVEPAEWSSTVRSWAGLNAARRRGVVTAINRVAAGVAEVTVKVGRSWPGHRAGQFVNVGVEIDGVRHTRSYSLTGPASPRVRLGAPTLSFAVFATPGGIVSNHLIEQLVVGDSVVIDGPFGEFSLASAPAERPLVLIAGGSGVTPILGMLREQALVSPELRRDVVAVVFQPHAAEAPFHAEFEEMANSGARVFVIGTRDGDGAHLAECLDGICPDWRSRDAFVCGPERLIEAVEERWLDAAAVVHTERFRPRVSAAAVEGETPVIEFARSCRSACGAEGETILETAEAAGLSPASGCRAGVCFTCTAPLVSGEVVDIRSGRRTSAGGHVQLCVSRATMPSVIDL